MKKISIILVFFFFVSSGARADTAKDAALIYKDCILKMAHISSKDIENVTAGKYSAEKKADIIAHLAAERCGGERAKLSKKLIEEGRTGAKFKEMPEKIEEMGIFAVKIQILNSIIKNTKK